MTRTITAQRVATLVGPGFLDQDEAMYAALADSLRLLIGDGRISLDTRLPSERDLTGVLGVSRTTVTRAYAELRERGFAEARRGAGTFTRLPMGRGGVVDRALAPRVGDEDLIDLNCAAPSAPPGLAEAYADAVGELPAYFSSHGYYPAGLPQLQDALATAYTARGLPTEPDQIMVTPGALSAGAVVAQALAGPGDRVMVEDPVYPNATKALAHRGARLVGAPVDPDGWDLDAIAAVVRQTSPRLAYLVPDFQNPTGNLMDERQREAYADLLARARTVAVVDEAHQALAVDGAPMPRPFAAFARDTITIGSASKSFWGGLRLGWLRAPGHRMPALMQARLGLDLGAPVLEQLVLARLLRDPEPVLAANRARLRGQRDALVAALAERIPDWRFRLPSGGLALWCELPVPVATAVVSEAERRGVVVAPGPVFAVEGGLEHFVRIPWTRPAEELVAAVDALAEAWAVARDGSDRGRRARITVA